MSRAEQEYKFYTIIRTQKLYFEVQAKNKEDAIIECNEYGNPYSVEVEKEIVRLSRKMR